MYFADMATSVSVVYTKIQRVILSVKCSDINTCTFQNEQNFNIIRWVSSKQYQHVLRQTCLIASYRADAPC